jgi:gamma-glutamylcyclotransferase (GGCT)/AIG2-like uncharacterized protein YtfP
VTCAPCDSELMDAQHRLATYGTLSPGRSNYHQLAGIEGHWATGVVHGRLVNAGWGAGLGFPGLVLTDDGPAVDVDIFESADLPKHWARLDEFEGAEYERVTTTARTADGAVPINIYVLREPTTQ